MDLKTIIRCCLIYSSIYFCIISLSIVYLMLLTGPSEVASSNADIGALIIASLTTFYFFIRKKHRVPSKNEYTFLVYSSTLITLIGDLALYWLYNSSNRAGEFDSMEFAFIFAYSLAKGCIGNILIYRWSGFGKWILRGYEAKKLEYNSVDKPSTESSLKKLSSYDIFQFHLRYFAVYAPFYALNQWASATMDFSGEWAISLLMTIIAAIYALSFYIKHINYLPKRSDYWLLVCTSAFFVTVFEFFAKLAIDYVRFDQLPEFRLWFMYMLGGVILYIVIHAIAYSKLIVWLIRSRTLSA